ncbi:MAG TPA: phosphoribosyltransferase family protein [Gemmatimonadales bacterium]
MPFLDRADAGRKLARALERFRSRDPVILALPRGGVPVGFEVARALRAPLDVMVVRKLGAPGHEELAVGAIAPGAIYVDRSIVRQLGVTPAYLERVAATEAKELERREQLYRSGRPPLNVEGRVAILVDDGLATGATMLAAVRWARARGAARIVACVPVAAAQSAALVRREADDVVCPCETPDLRSVAAWYGVFAPVSVEEVVALLDAGPLPTA